MAPQPPLLAACLIVRDEAERIQTCLDSLADLVDEVIVYDTGSVDGTPTLARAVGATVIEGYWDDDFARARNSAAAHCTATWVLSIDADEAADADVAALRDRLVTDSLGPEGVAVDGFVVDIRQAGVVGYVNHAVKLFRRSAVTWVGRVHEVLVPVDGSTLRTSVLEPGLLALDHDGYAAVDTQLAKARRNADLALTELRSLQRGVPADDRRLPDVLLDLGRSLIGCGQPQDGADCLDAVRNLVPTDHIAWAQATELLARLALSDGQYEPALALSAQLRSAGGSGSYADWLEAQAIAPLGQAAEALRLLLSISELVDSAGRQYDIEIVHEMRDLVLQLAA